MEPDTSRPSNVADNPTVRALRHHAGLVAVLLVLGAVAGWAVGASQPVAYSSTTRVLINPSIGNPFAPTPASVREDELTSLETEAQVVRSAEVLRDVAARTPDVTTAELEGGVGVNVPTNTQILEISFTAADPVVARKLADAVAAAYLANRERRFDSVTAARLDSVETQTLQVVEDLRAAAAASQTGSSADRAFNRQLADALRNELVSLRAQRTALENSETPAGAVIAPAVRGAGAGSLPGFALPLGGALAGAGLGYLLAVLLERRRDRVRAASDVVTAGLPVAVAVPSRRHATVGDLDDAIRRLRAHVLEREPRPDVVAVGPAGDETSDDTVAEALATSLAKAGHRVVLVQTDDHPAAGSLAIGVDGLAEALVHERLRVGDLLQPSVEPLLSLLPAGRATAQTRELLTTERLRTVLDPLVDEGHLVVVSSPAAGTVDGEAVFAAADLALVVVTLGRTRRGRLGTLLRPRSGRATTVAAVVVPAPGRGHSARPRLRLAGRRPVDAQPVGDQVATEHARGAGR